MPLCLATVAAYSLAPRKESHPVSLLLRTANQTRPPYTFYEAYTMLIPSQRHTALLAKMYAEFLEAVGIIPIEISSQPVDQVVLSLGSFILNVLFLHPRGLRADLYAVLEAFTLALYPATYSGVIVGYFGTAIVSMGIKTLKPQAANEG